MASTHRGFKYTKGKKVDDPPEELSYDALEESKSDSVRSKRKSDSVGIDSEVSKKKRGSNASAVSVASQKSTSSSRTAKNAQTKTVQKHHYPSSNFEISQELLGDFESQAHCDVLRQLVDEVVAAERLSLKQHFNSSQTKSVKGRRHILESLDSVLAELPGLVGEDCPRTAAFEAEERLKVSDETAPLLEAKRTLEQHLAKLKSFEEDLSLLAREHDLWFDADTISAKVSSVEAGAAKAAEEEDKMLGTRNTYQGVLKSLEGHCTAILGSADSSRAAMQQARDAQNALYDAVNKVRLEQAGRAKAPSDPKDLLRKMPAFM